MRKTKLKKNLKYFRKHQKVLNLLLETFEMNDYDYAIVGGFIRRSLMKTPDAFIGFKDFDVIVNISTAELKHILCHFRFKFDQNSNGGFKVKEWETSKFSNFTIDIWTLEDHIPFKLEPGLTKDFKGVANGSPLSIESGVYLPTKNKLYEHHLFDDLKHGKVGVNYDPGYHERPKIAARIKYLKNFCGFELDDNAKYLLEKGFNWDQYSRKKASKYYKHLIES